MNENYKAVREHTTHFDDCGCKTARLEAALEQCLDGVVEFINHPTLKAMRDQIDPSAIEKLMDVYDGFKEQNERKANHR